MVLAGVEDDELEGVEPPPIKSPPAVRVGDANEEVDGRSEVVSEREPRGEFVADRD